MSGPEESTLVRVLEITNKKGLHARASAKFVKCAEGFNANITVSRDGHSVPATSIMGLMMLAAGNGSKLDITCDGPDAAEASAALVTLVAEKFNEE